jgi:hypothetical protein
VQVVNPSASWEADFENQDRALSRDILSAQPDRALLTRKHRPEKQAQALSLVVPLRQSAGPQELAEDQAQIERAHMDQLPLEDVVMIAKVGAPCLCSKLLP